MPSAVTSEMQSGANVFSGSALRVPEAKRGRVPCDGAEEIYAAPPPELAQEQGGSPPLRKLKNQKVKHKSPDSEESGLHLCAILGSNQ